MSDDFKPVTVHVDRPHRLMFLPRAAYEQQWLKEIVPQHMRKMYDVEAGTLSSLAVVVRFYSIKKTKEDTATDLINQINEKLGLKDGERPSVHMFVAAWEE